jgi:hypothetical protein
MANFSRKKEGSGIIQMRQNSSQTCEHSIKDNHNLPPCPLKVI